MIQKLIQLIPKHSKTTLKNRVKLMNINNISVLCDTLVLGTRITFKQLKNSNIRKRLVYIIAFFDTNYDTLFIGTIPKRQ